MSQMTGSNTFSVNTKKSKNDTSATKTVVTVKWDGCPEDVAKSLAIQALVVKLQGTWRKHGIPAKVEIAAKDYAPGTRHGGFSTPQDLIAQLTPEQKRALIAEMQAKLDEENEEE